jgi:hypothetical protein
LGLVGLVVQRQHQQGVQKAVILYLAQLHQMAAAAAAVAILFMLVVLAVREEVQVVMAAHLLVPVVQQHQVKEIMVDKILVLLIMELVAVAVLVR